MNSGDYRRKHIPFHPAVDRNVFSYIEIIREIKKGEEVLYISSLI
jgi:hypothetical protein